MKNEGRWTLCRRFSLPRGDPHSELALALKGRVRIDPILDFKAPNLSGPYIIEVLYHRHSISTLVLGYSPRGSKQHTSQIFDCSSLRKKQSTSAMRTNLTARENPARIQPKYQVTEECRPQLRKFCLLCDTIDDQRSFNRTTSW